ncbi:pentapeptide repeat-containing protein [Actinokineospora sp. 24-640]
MTTLLRPDEIAERIDALRESLTPTQVFRLATIKDLVGLDGRFRLRAALEAGDFPSGDANAQDAFQDFRHKVNGAAERAGVDLRLELDSRKTSPDTRHGWFAGNPVEKGLVAYTAELSGQTGVDRPVTPEVAEIGDSRRLRVYVSYHPTTGPTHRRAGAIVKQLSDALRVTDGYVFEVGSPRSVGVGEDADQAPDRLSAEADVRVALISNEYLASGAERRRGMGSPGKVVAFALSAIPDGPVDLSPLRRHDVSRLDKPWDQLTTTAQRADYIRELVRQILVTVSRPAPRREDEAAILLTYMAERMGHRRQDESKHLVPSELTEISLRESRLDEAAILSTYMAERMSRPQDEASSETSLRGMRLELADKSPSPPLRAVDRLVAWATDDTPGAPRLCALLGDVGMGKTTTAKLFTQRLLDLHRHDPAVPMPVLFDLRDVRVTGLADSMTLDHILNSALDATRPATIPGDRLNAAVVRKRLEQGGTVIVFDGLDEVLVHLTPHDRQLFTRQLWRALTERSAARMLLTCRTQYFRTIRDQVTYFTGETRQGLKGSDYLALLMLPFRDEQIRAYLAGNLDRDEDWVDRFLETIAAVHDLPDLARRPITLRLIADQVEFIETAKLQGRTLRSVDIYTEVVDRWLSRDEGKHTLTPDHKRLLMEEIAAGLWRSGQNSWTPTQVDDWLLALLDRRPDLRRHYRANLPDLWTADFRTATFLKREGDTFQFGHRSLFEYFLARHLLRTLSTPNQDLDALALPVPNRETLDFLGQSLATCTAHERTAALTTLTNIARKYRPVVSEFALAYALHAHDHDHPCHSLVNVDLTGAALSDWKIGAEKQPLPMTGANLTAADLRRTTFHNVDLTNANLTGADTTKAEFHRSTLTGSTWKNTQATGAILRRCAINDVDFEQAHLYRTQLLFCTPPPTSAPGLITAPATHPSKLQSAYLKHFTSIGTPSNVVAWSPDGARLVTSVLDGGVWLWDAITGDQIFQLAGHLRGVSDVAWSPDGTRLLVSGFDGSVWVWDMVSGDLVLQVGDQGRAEAVAWSPDGSRLLTGSSDGGAQVWSALSGDLVLQVGGQGHVQEVAWSPDGTRLFAGSVAGCAQVWDAVTGEPVLHLAGNTAEIRGVAWSPDGTRLLTWSPEDFAQVWDADSGGQVLQLIELFGEIGGVAWSPDGNHLLTGSCDGGYGGARVLDAVSGDLVLQVDDQDWVQAVAWSPDGARLLTGSDSARVWDAVTGEQILHLAGYATEIRDVVWSPDGDRFLAGGGGARVWDAVSGDLVLQVGGQDLVSSVAWSPDGARLLTGGVGGARVWDVITGEQVFGFDRHFGGAWSPDGTRLLTGSSDGGAQVWSAVSGDLVLQVGGQDWVSLVAWSPDGARFLTGGGGAWVWDAVTGERVFEFARHYGGAWSPDGTRLLTGGSGGAWVWDAVTGKQVLKLDGYFEWARTLKWSPDGTRILTGSADGSAQVWDAVTGEQVFRLRGHSGAVQAAAWSPDGTRILTGSADGSARVWDAATGRTCDIAFVQLDRDEVAVYRPVTNTVIGCTPGAWRWLGWSVLRDGRLDRLPAETFGELPPLRTLQVPSAGG